MFMETVLIVGATASGVSAAIAAIRAKRRVLAIVRSQASAEKLFKHVDSLDNITTVEADVSTDGGVRGVIDQVRAGKLPAFQHVWSSVGGEYVPTPLSKITAERLRYNMNVAFEANFFAYRDAIEYLWEQKHPRSTFTICTGAQGDLATFALPALTQGPLFSMATAAARENEKTNVRFNEVYLAFRVEVDKDAKEHGVTKASEFANVYQKILDDERIRSSRVMVTKTAQIHTLDYRKKF